MWKTLTQVYFNIDVGVCTQSRYKSPKFLLCNFPKYSEYPQKLIYTKNEMENLGGVCKVSF